MKELVEAVDQHPLFTGTKALYEAELWDLLQQKSIKPQAVEKRINELMHANGLVRRNLDAAGNLVKLINKYGHGPVFDRCFRLSLRKLKGLSPLTLIWLTYLQTESAHNWPIREIVEKIADKRLDDFFARHFPSTTHISYYEDAIAALQHSRLDMSDPSHDRYGYLEVEVTWPIIPIELVDSI